MHRLVYNDFVPTSKKSTCYKNQIKRTSHKKSFCWLKTENNWTYFYCMLNILPRQKARSKTDQSQLPLSSSFQPIGVRFNAGFSWLNEPGMPYSESSKCYECRRTQQKLEPHQMVKPQSRGIPWCLSRCCWLWWIFSFRPNSEQTQELLTQCRLIWLSAEFGRL